MQLRESTPHKSNQKLQSEEHVSNDSPLLRKCF